MSYQAAPSTDAMVGSATGYMLATSGSLAAGISAVVDMFMSECGTMREAKVLADFEREIENGFPTSGDHEEDGVKD